MTDGETIVELNDGAMLASRKVCINGFAPGSLADMVC